MRKRRRKLLEVVVNVCLFAGLLVALRHLLPSYDGRRLLLLGFGLIAMVNLVFFHLPRMVDPEDDSEADDVERFKLWVIVLWVFIYLVMWIMLAYWRL
jgi:hypothetical protein